MVNLPVGTNGKTHLVLPWAVIIFVIGQAFLVVGWAIREQEARVRLRGEYEEFKAFVKAQDTLLKEKIEKIDDIGTRGAAVFADRQSSLTTRMNNADMRYNIANDRLNRLENRIDRLENK